MHKEFDIWNTKKKGVHSTDSSCLYFYEREIWWCNLGANIGIEQDGKGAEFLRPVLIYKKFTRSLFLGIPLSTKISRGNFFFPLLAKSNTIRMAVLAQIRSLDSKRLTKKVDMVSLEEHQFVKENITALIR